MNESISVRARSEMTGRSTPRRGVTPASGGWSRGAADALRSRAPAALVTSSRPRSASRSGVSGAGFSSAVVVTGAFLVTPGPASAAQWSCRWSSASKHGRSPAGRTSQSHVQAERRFPAAAGS